ncbi:MAG: cell wall hydrolase [Pseudomonadota bacterium]
MRFGFVSRISLLSLCLKSTCAGALGLGFAAISPSDTAFQDITHLSRAGVDGTPRWLTHLVEVPTGSVVEANAGAIDQVITGSVTKSLAVKSERTTRLLMPNGQPLPDIDDNGPQRINRSLKGDRVVSGSKVRPPENFTAGSVLELRSSLEAPASEPVMRTAFNPIENSHHSPVQVALAFQYPAQPAIDQGGATVMLASLNPTESTSGSQKSATTTVTAYAAPENDTESVFAAVLKGERTAPIEKRLLKGDHKWASKPLTRYAFTPKQQRCLAVGIYFEARGEPIRGQAAVAQVILNRVKNPKYPNSICGVVYQNKNWRNRCQFSFACDGIRDRVRSTKLWKQSQKVAADVTAGKVWIKEVGSSTHYHATYVRPRWAKRLKRMKKIGRHIFYRTYGGGWS